MAGLRRDRPLSALPGTLRLVCCARLLAGSLLPQWISNHHREIESLAEIKA